MAKPYEITISNGTGTATVENGTYNVVANVPGYDNSTINPASVTVTQSTSSYNFTISATGTLTIHITDNGTSSGTAVEGATLVIDGLYLNDKELPPIEIKLSYLKDNKYATKAYVNKKISGNKKWKETMEMDKETREKLILIYNTLLGVSTKGEDTIIMSDCIKSLRSVILDTPIIKSEASANANISEED